MTTGYSGTPLVKKLGIKPRTRWAFLSPPGGFPRTLGPLPDAVTVLARLPARADGIVAFFTERADLTRRLPALGRVIHPDGLCWIAWPKRASGVPTDITEDTIREIALPLGLVDTKVCAIDATWSGLRLVWRTERR